MPNEFISFGKIIIVIKKLNAFKINKEDESVVESLCVIFEGTEEWDEAIKYRTLLSKINNNNQYQRSFRISFLGNCQTCFFFKHFQRA